MKNKYTQNQTTNQTMKSLNPTQKKYIIIGAAAILGLILMLTTFNPLGYNHGGERTVITQLDGTQFVRYETGTFYSGFFAKEAVWPNQISVSYSDSVPSNDFEDNVAEIGRVTVRFNDATTAKLKGIVQFMLPMDDSLMIEMHNTHRTPLSLVKRRLSPYTLECIQSSAQLMSSEMCYSGGQAQMSTDYLDQLRNGSFLLNVYTKNVYDSIERISKPIYVTEKQVKGGQLMRKFSSIKDYGIGVNDAQITDVDYEIRVDDMLAQKIKASTDASIAKQQLMTAQQKALTAKAQGEQKLVETEYAKKVEQTTQMVAAETKVKLAETYKAEQKMAAEAAIFAAQKVRTDADAESYKNRQMVAAGLTPQEKAEFTLKMEQARWEGIKGMSWPTNYFGGGGNSGSQREDVLTALLTNKLIEK
jgi:hypothetical protein